MSTTLGYNWDYLSDMAATKPFKIGFIIGSQRKVRVAPQIADFVLETLQLYGEQRQDKRNVEFDRIDLAEKQLPIFDEPIIPQHVKSANGYHNEHTKQWSRCIAKQDAFIMLSAQRNWGIPAELKNAIDYLYHEWFAKPVLLITYGGHGGSQCAEQLRSVLSSMRMHVIETEVNMAFPDADFRTKAFQGRSLGLDAFRDDGPWTSHRKEFLTGLDELLQQLSAIGHRVHKVGDTMEQGV